MAGCRRREGASSSPLPLFLLLLAMEPRRPRAHVPSKGFAAPPNAAAASVIVARCRWFVTCGAREPTLNTGFWQGTREGGGRDLCNVVGGAAEQTGVRTMCTYRTNNAANGVSLPMIDTHPSPNGECIVPPDSLPGTKASCNQLAKIQQSGRERGRAPWRASLK